MRIGFAGLGTMGAPMALNLKRKGGFDVVVWNRSLAKAEALAAVIAALEELVGQRIG